MNATSQRLRLPKSTIIKVLENFKEFKGRTAIVVGKQGISNPDKQRKFLQLFTENPNLSSRRCGTKGENVSKLRSGSQIEAGLKSNKVQTTLVLNAKENLAVNSISFLDQVPVRCNR